MAGVQRLERKQAVSGHKRALILEAARKVFEEEGLDGASLRAIAKAAGYTPAALYFHFDSKEAIYAEVLQVSIARLQEEVEKAVTLTRSPAEKLRAAAMAFFEFYTKNPRDLDLGFYLFRGGMKPHGLGRERDQQLNSALASALRSIGDAARELGAKPDEAKMLTVDTFAHAAGLLLLAHTGRIRMFGASARELMADYVESRIASFKRR